MIRQKISRRFHLILLTLAAAVVLNLAYARPCDAFSLSLFGKDTPEEEAYKKSREDFDKVKDGAAAFSEETVGALEKAQELEAAVNAQIKARKKKGQSIPPELFDLETKAKKYRETLQSASEVATKFADYSSKATTALDVYDDINKMAQSMDENSKAFGQLGGALTALASVMEYGENIPLIGEAIKGYGTITLGTLDAIKGVSASVEKNIHQGTLSDQNTLASSEQMTIFKKFQKEHLAELLDDSYAPSSPSYLYVPSGHEAHSDSVLWDSETKTFSVVSKKLPAKQIYKMNLLLERDEPLKADQLRALLDTWEKDGVPKLKTARKLLPRLDGLRKGHFTDVGGKGLQSEGIYGLIDRPEVFEARYVYDTETRERVHRSIKKIHDDLMQDGSDPAKAKAAEIRKWAGNLGITFKKPAPPQPEKKTVQKEEPSSFGGFFKSLSDGLDKLNKDLDEFNKGLEKYNTTTSAPQKSDTPPPAEPKKVEAKPATPPKPAVKSGSVAGSCNECWDNGLDCSCGMRACRCCAPGDSNCNAFDL